MRALALSLLLIACGTTVPPPAPIGEQPTPSLTLRPPIASDTPPPTEPRSPRPLSARAAGTFPQRFRLVSVQWVDAVRVWLVDLGGASPSRLVAGWDVPDRARFLIWDEQWTASRDGRTLVVSAYAHTGRAALYVVRAETGDVSVFRDDADADLIAPRLTPDGRRVAFTRVPVRGDGAHTDDGIWVGAVGTPDVSRLVDPTTAPEISVPAAWSEDARWLAFRRHFEGSRVAIVAPSGAPSVVGAGRWVDWRAQEPRLLVGDSANPFGSRSRLAVYDVAKASLDVLYGPTDTIVTRPRWQPARDRFLYLESAGPPFLGPGPFQVFERSLVGSATARGAAGAYLDAWWSDDGARVYALSGGDDSVWGIVDVDARRTVATVCLRGDAPPCP